MIQRILVPTDFSELAANALTYAQRFAEYLEVPEIDVVHIFAPQTAPDAVVLPPVNELMESREASLQRFIQEASASQKVSLNSSVQLGFPADELTQRSADYDLIIMSTTGDGTVLERLFGSTSSEVSRRAQCPVLLVPPEASFSEYRHILYASSDLSTSRKTVLQFMEFNHLFRARVHFLHINDNDGDSYRGERERLFATLFAGPEPEFAFDITEIQAESVSEGLQNYLHEHPIDLAVMVTQRRPFWSAFFHKSQTKAMVLHAEIPMMILHLEDH